MGDFIDDIFESLYGTSWCDDTNETYAEYYSFESRGVWDDIVENVTILLDSKYEVDENDVSKIIFLAEHNHIGNDKRDANLVKLKEVSNNVLKYIKSQGEGK